MAPLLCFAADRAAPRYAQGALTFAANCAVCHGPAGAGQPALAPPLTSYPARYAANAEGRRQLALTLLYGMFGDIVVEQNHFNFKMPDFSRLPDSTLAAVLNFVVFDLGRAAACTKPLRAKDIAAERSRAVDGAAVRAHRADVLAMIGIAGTAMAGPAQDYMLYCMGCHGAQAQGVPGKVPALAHVLGRYMRNPVGRDYVLRVPGAANSALSDAQLAAVLNWIAAHFGAGELSSDAPEFTAVEVARSRRSPLAAVESTRRDVVRQLSRTGLAPPPSY